MRGSAFAPTTLATRTYVTFALLMLVWTLAWLGKVAMDARSDWFASPAPTALFWFVAKCLIWILPACYLIHVSGRRWSVVFNLPGWRQCARCRSRSRGPGPWCRSAC